MATLRLLSHCDQSGNTYLFELLRSSREYCSAVSDILSVYRDVAAAKEGWEK